MGNKTFYLIVALVLGTICCVSFYWANKHSHELVNQAVSMYAPDSTVYPAAVYIPDLSHTDTMYVYPLYPDSIPLWNYDNDR